MPAPPGCIWVILIERPCSCVSPGEPGDTAARATRLGAGTDTALPIPQNGRKKKTQKNPQTNGEFSPASAFSDNSSCASAGPGHGSVPVNRPKPSAIQIACGAAAGTTGCSCGRDAVPSWLRAPSSPGMKEGRCRMFSQLFLSLSRLLEVGEAIKRKEVEKGRCWCPDPAVRGRMGQADPQWPNPC